MFGKKWGLFKAHYNAYSSQAYKDIMRSTDRLASSTLALIDSKPPDERMMIIEKSSALGGKVLEMVGYEDLLVTALALLTAVHVCDETVARIGQEMRTAKNAE